MMIKNDDDKYKLNEFKNKLVFYEVLKEFLVCYAGEFIGEVEIDTGAVAYFLNSDKYLIDYQINKYSKDDLFKLFEEDILNGYPVWEFFKLNDWTKNILVKNFKDEEAERIKEMEKKYDCLTCSLFKVNNTTYGVVYKCNFVDPEDEMSRIFNRGILSELVEHCENKKEKI